MHRKKSMGINTPPRRSLSCAGVFIPILLCIDCMMMNSVNQLAPRERRLYPPPLSIAAVPQASFPPAVPLHLPAYFERTARFYPTQYQRAVPAAPAVRKTVPWLNLEAPLLFDLPRHNKRQDMHNTCCLLYTASSRTA